MPIKLRAVLQEKKIPIGDWAKSIKQKNGNSLSPSAASQLINWGVWPRSTTKKSIQTQTSQFLASQKITLNKISTIWDVEPEDSQDNLISHGRPPGRKSRVVATNEFDRPLPEPLMLSQKARKHFRLFTDPFRNDITCNADVFLSSEQRYIHEAMKYAAKHGGFIAVVGDPGAGKTVLVDRLEGDISSGKETIKLIRPRAIDKSKITAGSICEAIIYDISLEKPKRSLEAKARQVERLLKLGADNGTSYCLLIDEGHDLTNPILRYLKRFREIRDGLRVLMGVIVVGQSELLLTLDAARNPDIKEVIARIEIATLKPLDGDIKPYLETKFKRINKPLGEVFAPDAYDAIQLSLMRRNLHSKKIVSVSFPLMVNNAVTAAMNIAADAGLPVVNKDVLKEI